MIKISRVVSAILCSVLILQTGCSLFDRIPTKKELSEKAGEVAEKAKEEITKKAVGNINSFLRSFHDKGVIGLTEEELSEIVVSCFSESKTDILKNMFCVKTQELSDIDEQILEGFNFFEGKVISFNDKVLAYERSHIEYGKKTLLERGWAVKDIETDAGRTYKLYIRVYFIYQEDKSREGISQITITREDGKECEIGYIWPDHYQEGTNMSRKIVGMFDAGDKAGLKSLFCAKSLETADINQQIQEAFDFYQGIAIAGKVDDPNIVYDGKHDYHTSVRDDEVVINHEPIRTNIAAHISNIETNAGRTYEMDFYAYILCADNEALKGISQIIITDDNGKKRIIGERIN
jgi:hypothetical protein